jgi:hypothetical protein
MFEKIKKIFQKPLDKSLKVCYNIYSKGEQGVESRARPNGTVK